VAITVAPLPLDIKYRIKYRFLASHSDFYRGLGCDNRLADSLINIL
jgi:hypothetical protein